MLVATASASGRSAHRLLVGWDAQWYRGIAEDGYGFVRVHEDGRMLSDYAFFPLYPGLERLLADLTRVGYSDAGLLLSWVAALLAGWGVFAIADYLYDRKSALLAVVLWAALPVAIVSSMAYSESLFTALAAWSLYAVLSGRWVAAGLLGCLAGLTRPVGIAVALAVTVPALLASRQTFLESAHRSGRGPRTVAPLTAAVLAPLGWIAYVAWVGWRRASPTGYFDVANDWGNGFDGGAAFSQWVWQLLSSSAVGSGIAVCAAVALFLWLLWRTFRQRQPLPLLIFSTLLVVAALATSGYFGSKPRYLLPAFPLLFPAARWLARQRTARIVAAVGLLTSFSAVYGTVWLLGPGPP